MRHFELKLRVSIDENSAGIFHFFCSLFYQVLLIPYFSLGFRLNKYDLAIGSNYIMLTFSSFLRIFARDRLACDAARNTIIIIHFYSSVQSLIVIAVLSSSDDYVLLTPYQLYAIDQYLLHF